MGVGEGKEAGEVLNGWKSDGDGCCCCCDRDRDCDCDCDYDCGCDGEKTGCLCDRSLLLLFCRILTFCNWTCYSFALFSVLFFSILLFFLQVSFFFSSFFLSLFLSCSCLLAFSPVLFLFFVVFFCFLCVSF